METKVCKYCGNEKPLSHFEVAVILKGKVYRRLKCTTCKNRTQRQRRRTLRAWVEAYKKARCCEHCGFSDYRALEFHHLDPREKESTIGEMLSTGTSLVNMRREIEKCILLCANCHAIVHYEDTIGSNPGV